MPLISIVMPTYNRGDTIQRAIASIHAQSWSDWELLVVDDGSTDDTASRLAGLDPRIRFLRQENQGVTAARNTGLAAVKGELVAFLDSDDEWLPHHLALAAAFFAAHPGEHLFTSEFWEDFGTGDYVKHYRPEVGEFAPRTAKRIGSAAFDGPAPQGDPYLRLYDSRAPVGEWAHPVFEKTPYAGTLHYRGNIFRGWRWEFLMSMQSTVLTRAALERVGTPDAKYKVASDYAWLALLCRAFTTNMVNAPGTIKHEYGAGRKPLAEGHLATGKTALRCHQDMLQIFEDLFWKDAPEDPELRGIRAYRQFKLAELLLARGERHAALEHLDRAVQDYRGLDAKAARWLARLVPRDQLSSRVFVASQRAATLPARVAGRIRRATALPQGAAPPAPSPLVPAAPATRAPSGPALRAEDVEVKVVRSREQFAPLFGELAALNLASRRPCPFSTPEFLSLTLEHDEFAAPGDKLLFLLGYAGGRVVGYLPLRKTTRRALGIPYERIEGLSLGDRDRPYAVARAEDEAACAAAFYRHLRERERSWSMFELTSQDAASAFHAIVDAPGRGYWARRFETDPNTTIPLPFTTLADYFKSLDGDFRRNVTARCRKLLTAGRVEVVSSSEPAARGALLDMYLDVETRSWKASVGAGIARHPERLAFFRALCASPLTTVLQVVLLDGVPIAGLTAIELEESWYILETTYDSAYSDLAPGYLLHLVALGEAIARGQGAFNLLHAYAYYKKSWNGVATETAAVQVYRVPSVPYFKARAGELKRLRARGGKEEEQFNPARRAAGEQGSAKDGPRPPRDEAARLAAAALARLATVRSGVRSLAGGALVATLPFPLEAKAPKAKAKPAQQPGISKTA
jgi:glycosyltransferase involved in cell wall biosynthesis/CelD/BcsL family acetyltransferase involved in cellulose biosynthesis